MWKCHLISRLEPCAKVIKECATWAFPTRERREAKLEAIFNAIQRHGGWSQVNLKTVTIHPSLATAHASHTEGQQPGLDTFSDTWISWELHLQNGINALYWQKTQTSKSCKEYKFLNPTLQCLAQNTKYSPPLISVWPLGAQSCIHLSWNILLWEPKITNIFHFG